MMRIYGQTGIFGAFVLKRQCFCQMQRLINQRAKLFWVISIIASDCHAYEKNGSILNGVDDDFSTPFFVFTKYLRNAIK